MAKPINYQRVLASNLRRARKARGLSQERLAELADYHVNFIGLLEREAVNPTLKSLVRLAKVLRCQPHELLKPE